MTPTRAAVRFQITGVVQGVGFRPFVHRLATELGLDGRVGNTSTEVFVDAAGPEGLIDEFERRVRAEAPPLAVIEHVGRRNGIDHAVEPGSGFTIVASEAVVGGRTLVSPDVAVCDACLAEMSDPSDRRYRHPFITCTDCGPRFTIITDVPYDRSTTTMAGFPMCASCRAEYNDIGGRRHHAQPISCHQCGPTLSTSGGRQGADALAATVDALAAGRVVALKGLGGFHLACDATSAETVARLRARKQRPDKPFAVMVRDLAAVRKLAVVNDREAELLLSPARPIVLLVALSDTPLAELVAPGNPLIGVMLPYTPVHHLLFADGCGPLVMTSGNVAGEPICHRDDEVADRLGHLVDDVLTHDRPIAVPCDDSVVRLVGDRLLPVRRARGYAPLPVRFPDAHRPVLAVGGELKNTACITTGTHAFVSQHLGDMENQRTVEAFESTVDSLLDFWSVTPEAVAVDAHPGYATSAWARRRHPQHRIIEVQHHHAHVAAVMAEHGLDPAEPVIGFAFDGTGYGSDGTIWGGEVLVATATSFDRIAHLATVDLAGGDAAVRHPARVALSHLRSADVDWDRRLSPVATFTEAEQHLFARVLDRQVQCVPTSSMGRLFDAVASLLGLRHRITFEAQAAIDLEIAAARTGHGADVGSFAIDGSTFDAAPVVRSLAAAVLRGESVESLARGFHLAVARLVAELARRTCEEGGVDTVVLSGGVFQNALLVELTTAALSDVGVSPLTHGLVPPNDGGLALGQAYVAAHTLQEY